MLRDNVKSMKNNWDEAAYIPDLADSPTVFRVTKRFLELRDDSFTGRFVLRRFEEVIGPEARTWWIGGRCAKSFQIFPIVVFDSPVRSAIFARVQCVAFGGVDSSVATITSSI